MTSKILSLLIIPLLTATMSFFGRLIVALVNNFKIHNNFERAISIIKKDGIIFSPELCLVTLGADIVFKYKLDNTKPDDVDIFLIIIFSHILLWLLTLVLLVFATKNIYRIYLNNGIGAFAFSSIIFLLMLW